MHDNVEVIVQQLCSTCQVPMSCALRPLYAANTAFCATMRVPDILTWNGAWDPTFLRLSQKHGFFRRDPDLHSTCV